MGERQQMLVAVKIGHGKGQLVVVPAAVLRAAAEVIQGVVHPP